MDLLQNSGNVPMQSSMTMSKISGFNTVHGMYPQQSRQMIDNWHSTSSKKRRSYGGGLLEEKPESKIIT